MAAALAFAALACFFAAFAFLWVFTLLDAEAVAAGLAAGAGVACAANEMPAIANEMARPMIAEVVFVMVLSVLIFGSVCFFRFPMI